MKKPIVYKADDSISGITVVGHGPHETTKAIDDLLRFGRYLADKDAKSQKQR